MNEGAREKAAVAATHDNQGSLPSLLTGSASNRNSRSPDSNRILSTLCWSIAAIRLWFAGTIVASLLISPHTWWARLAPQLWWLPILAVVGGLAVPELRALRWAAGGLAALLLANAVLVGVAHFRWEIEATRTLRKQMAFLRQQRAVEVEFRYFGEPFGERLRAAGVAFRAVRRLQCDDPMELQSVAPGYPFPVRVCVLDLHENNPSGPQSSHRPD